MTVLSIDMKKSKKQGKNGEDNYYYIVNLAGLGIETFGIFVFDRPDLEEGKEYDFNFTLKQGKIDKIINYKEVV